MSMSALRKSLDLLRYSTLARSLSSQASPGVSFTITEDQAEMVNMAERFCREEVIPVAAHHDKTGEFPWDIIKKAHATGLMNLHIPPEYGGVGINVLDGCLIGEKFCYACSGIAVAVGANGLATAPVLLAGSDTQKKKYLVITLHF